ncbi:MAG: glycoside hydrolase family 13 protein [Actinomyces sp.]|jgi:alpha-glucosidase|nr:glycoside hydrolase family 13 protein [Actinomyces sp.]MCI1787212.1 glycoside hydrolase family 13 protein [Actinomyces sp.]MCI1829606.1 glycoside hydrolase family 13 protein [Actinomyces sp.]MCI1866697.1 glycoside hydrolase family 13 protein [Actinomyces sp.]
MPQTTPPSADWWRSAVIYQIYPRSFADSDGDGIGDLPGITTRLDHLTELGVDAVWLSPFYTSPQADAGYDVSNYRDVDPVFGTLADFRILVVRARDLGLRVIVDIVPNHTSDEHPWFKQALAAGPGSPERERYMFRDGRGPGGDEPPNNWQSAFYGPAWTRVTESDGSPGQWYLHLFDAKQPDLNWANERVRAEFDGILRFWLDLGVDGFRVDVARGLVKADGLPDYPVQFQHASGESGLRTRSPLFDQPGVHAVYRRWRSLLAEYGPDKILVAEAHVRPPSRLAQYVRPDEMHQAFNFEFLDCPYRARDLRAVITESLDACGSVGAPSTWVLNNHDDVRHVSRLGLPVGTWTDDGIGPRDQQPDLELGTRRALAMTLVQLALPGSAYIYQGEEVGLPEHTQLPDQARQDPMFARSGGRAAGRDGCRVPIPWEPGTPARGFSPSGRTWLPQGEDWDRYAVSAQRGVDGSVYELYRAALRLRREYGLGIAALQWVTLPGAGEDVLSFQVGDVLVVASIGGGDVPMPAGDVLLASAPLGGGALPPDATVWIRRRAA